MARKTARDTAAPSVAPAKEAAPAAPAVKSESKGAKFVTVACRLPMGMVLQLCRETKYFEDTPSGTRERVRFDKAGERHYARGTSYPAMPPANHPPRPMMVGNCALTPNIPADFWAEWIKQHASTDLVRNHQIFAYTALADVKAHAIEHKSVTSGLEPMNPLGDPRAPKPIDGVSGVQVADEMKGRLPQLDEVELAEA